MADRMCCYGNCDSETVAVTVNVKGNPTERLVYCCLEHAANALSGRYQRELAIRRLSLSPSNQPVTKADQP
jgi:hypothetical protein